VHVVSVSGWSKLRQEKNQRQQSKTGASSSSEFDEGGKAFTFLREMNADGFAGSLLRGIHVHGLRGISIVNLGLQ
jgi:hypothetical protein